MFLPSFKSNMYFLSLFKLIGNVIYSWLCTSVYPEVPQHRTGWENLRDWKEREMLGKEKNRWPVCSKGRSERVSEPGQQTGRSLHGLETQGRACLIYLL